MNESLLKMNFDRTLMSLWVEVLEEFKDALFNEEPVNLEAYVIVFINLFYTN